MAEEDLVDFKFTSYETKVPININSVIIKSYVSSIREYAFSYCSSLTSVTFELPSSVENIENYAFYECSSLTSVEIPSSVTNIGNYAFSWCTALESVEIPSSVTNIGDDAFEGCTSLRSVEFESDSVTNIGKYAFPNTEELTITIRRIEKIGDNGSSLVNNLREKFPNIKVEDLFGYIATLSSEAEEAPIENRTELGDFFHDHDSYILPLEDFFVAKETTEDGYRKNKIKSKSKSKKKKSKKMNKSKRKSKSIKKKSKKMNKSKRKSKSIKKIRKIKIYK